MDIHKMPEIFSEDLIVSVFLPRDASALLMIWEREEQAFLTKLTPSGVSSRKLGGAEAAAGAQAILREFGFEETFVYQRWGRLKDEGQKAVRELWKLVRGVVQKADAERIAETERQLSVVKREAGEVEPAEEIGDVEVPAPGSEPEATGTP